MNLTSFPNPMNVHFSIFNSTNGFSIFFISQMDVDSFRGEGFRQYYITKIEELQLTVAEKSQNLRRLQAQRNELNAKGTSIHSNHL